MVFGIIIIFICVTYVQKDILIQVSKIFASCEPLSNVKIGTNKKR